MANMATNKISIRVSADPEQIEWVDRMVKEGVYSSRSHAYRHAVGQLMKLQRIRSGE